MKHLPVLLRLFALTSLAVAGGALCARCGTTGSSSSSDGGVDAQADVQADAAGWDPVWHETEPAEWPTVGPEGQPDCGPGCRMALNVPIRHPGYFVDIDLDHPDIDWQCEECPALLLRSLDRAVRPVVARHVSQESGVRPCMRNLVSG